MQAVETRDRTTPAIAVKITTVETPTHLLGWLPIVWTRALFTGPPAPSGPWRWQPLALLFVLSGVLLYPCMSFHLFEPDEGRYAQIPREMLTTGEWIVPTLQGEPYLDKPPLFYWLVMLSYALFGYHDWAARLVPALAMHASILLIYVLGRRIVGERPAFWGALLLTVSPLFLGVGRLLVLDGILTLWVTLALLAWGTFSTCHEAKGHVGNVPHGRGWFITAAIACGLGVLTKGPVALVLVLIPIWTNRWLSPGERIPWRAWLGFFAIIAAMNLPWYAAVCWQRPEFAAYFLWQHNVERFVDPFDHVRPVWFYVPIVLFGLLPAILLAWPLWRILTSTQAEETSARCPAMGYLLLAGVWCVFFFSLAGSKLPTYILPAFPPLCLALGCFVARTEWYRSRLLIELIAVCWLTLACSHYIIIPRFAHHKSPIGQSEIVREYCSDPDQPVICFPRNVDSVAFYTGRSDFRTYRSKQIDQAVQALEKQPRTVVLFGHRNSPETLKHHLPPHLRLVECQKMGLCEMGVVERVR